MSQTVGMLRRVALLSRRVIDEKVGRGMGRRGPAGRQNLTRHAGKSRTIMVTRSTFGK